MSLTQEQLNSLREGARLGMGAQVSDLRYASNFAVAEMIRTMSNGMLALIDEVERLRAGLDVAQYSLGLIKKAGDESEKDPSLSWYEDDRHHDKKVEFGMEAEDILEAIDRAMDS